MPLSRARMRERKKRDRAVKPKQETLGALRKLIESKSGFDNTNVKPELPIYNPAIHRAGDRVLVQRGKKLIETVIPEIDGGGNPIPDYW